MSESKPELRTLYPEIEPYNSGHLLVDEEVGHEIYYEECGNPNGKPVVFLHGGPGGGAQLSDRRFFDPEAYRVVLLDQRGCGRSKPLFNLQNNTTWHLVADIEKIREHLKIDKWIVFGGSWGSTLSLSYAEKHPERVNALCLRGIFTLRRRELEFFYCEGSSWLFPDYFEPYQEIIDTPDRKDMIAAYYKVLTDDSDKERQLKAAKAWTRWEMATSRLYVDEKKIERAANSDFALAFARVECHYFVNGGFFEVDDQVIRDAKILREHNIPGFIVQGRYDMVCPAKTAWDLHKEWPEAEFVLLPDAGHSTSEPGITDQLVRAMDRFRDL